MNRSPNFKLLFLTIILAILAPQVSQAVGNVLWLPTEGNSYMHFRYNGYVNSELETPIAGAEDLKIFTSELHAQAGIVTPLGPEESSLAARILYGWVNFDLGDFAGREEFPRFDKTIYLQLEGRYRWWSSRGFGIDGSLVPGLASDLSNKLNSSEWTFRAGVWGLWKPRLDSEWVLGLGGVHNYIYGEPFFAPSIIAEYDVNPWLVLVQLPSLAMVNYDIGANFDLSIIYEVWGNRFARDKELYPELTDPYLSYSVTSMGGSVGYTFDEHLHLLIEGGYLFDRKLRILDGDTDSLILDLENNLYWRALVTWGGNLW